ncbi:MAG: class I SAM-dependent methyltransferase [bacterium]|nr:class I SAM-dependent methyltransferase [bacterium]
MQPDLTWQPGDYQLLDFGNGRKLERFGGYVLDRVCPAALAARKQTPARWKQADLVLDAKGQPVRPRLPLPSSPEFNWSIRFDAIQFALRLTPFGHVGVFPEQALSWRWLDRKLNARGPYTGNSSSASEIARPLFENARALNLFAYTGGTSMFLASRGLNVVHVDASAPAVAWARSNALLSGLQQAPIRWIVEDARKFVAREVRRGAQYDFVILDPPSYGHGPKGQRWSIVEDLPYLLELCTALLKTPDTSHILLTSHSAEPTPEAISRMLTDDGVAATETGEMALHDESGRALNAGFFVRTRAC